MTRVPLTTYTLVPGNILLFLAKASPQYLNIYPGLLFHAYDASHPPASRRQHSCASLVSSIRPDDLKPLQPGMRGFVGLDQGTLCSVQRGWLSLIAASNGELQECLVRLWSMRFMPMNWHLIEPLELRTGPFPPK